MILWLIVNVENWDIRRPLPRTALPPPMGNPLIPDLPNWSWHEYGMRVGFWRILDCLKSFSVTPTLATNGSVCEAYPQIINAAVQEGWELMGHGWLQAPMHSLEDQRASIRRTIEAIRDVSGKSPRGWESPGLTETLETVDLLAAEGIEYVADWVLDDQPCQIQTSSGTLVSLPYTVEINDVAMMAVAQHSSDELLNRGIRQFNRLFDESAEIARIMSISVHPYLTGVPHRIGYLEDLLKHIVGRSGAVFLTDSQILDWYREARAKEGVGSKAADGGRRR